MELGTLAAGTEGPSDRLHERDGNLVRQRGLICLGSPAANGSAGLSILPTGANGNTVDQKMMFC